MDDPPSPRRNLRGQVLRVLTFTQNSSALVFSVFLGVHLASPLSAAIGGSSLADKTMMIARDYYLPYEPLLVFAPIAVHLSSSLLRRIIISSQTRRLPPLTPHILTGYALPFFLIPHILSHRIHPSSPHPPISRLSPSELDFEFVGWSLRKWPGWSVISYGGLVLIACWHAGVGMMKIVSWLRGPRVTGGTDPAPRRKISGGRKLGLRGILGVVLGVVGIGLVRIARDTGKVSRIMETRYEAVYASLPWGSLLR
ncbi:hypothetical protein BD324DRAFT_652367 [Kockovaella imperatae]|uniref:Mitochondrial adapter protein MCP1 transmembrane domain-containing protein n=1 Tax=Kockovaella imperatae TaxID=4999 RepID=A0A1Y1UDS2_9TREE|nr:hypothetical protein BD324DRAFT_652367 [Kockovaella imperatae]ORX35225.1 hypothetical protein BD324DRAFT_652367 [Kockovaella imperatae]